MTNHVHLLATPNVLHALSLAMQDLGTSRSAAQARKAGKTAKRHSRVAFTAEMWT
jgi:hypothetical protein